MYIVYELTYCLQHMSFICLYLHSYLHSNMPVVYYYHIIARYYCMYYVHVHIHDNYTLLFCLCPKTLTLLNTLHFN